MKTLQTYIVGYVLSLGFTLLPVALLVLYPDPQFEVLSMLAMLFVVFALMQFVVQVLCFLHVGQDEDSGGRVPTFVFTLIITIILVGGTLWIMGNLNHMSTMNRFYPDGVITPSHQRD